MKFEENNFRKHLKKLRHKRKVLKHAIDYEIKLLISVNNKIKHIKRIYRKVRGGLELTDQEKRIWDKIQKYRKQQNIHEERRKNRQQYKPRVRTKSRCRKLKFLKEYNARRKQILYAQN